MGPFTHLGNRTTHEKSRVLAGELEAAASSPARACRLRDASPRRVPALLRTPPVPRGPV